MKLIFKTILIFLVIIPNSYASQILITYEDNKAQYAYHMQKYFKENYKIPLTIIKIKKSYECRSIDKRFLEICINKKGELIQFSNSNIKKIIKSLRTFTLGGQNV